ncbi:MAG TPA: hypothetical protein VNO52_18190, partial [Methylomirabilota bacterium]|nr:hypothetical protein [Methylomirabilota bacterium]
MQAIAMRHLSNVPPPEGWQSDWAGHQPRRRGRFPRRRLAFLGAAGRLDSFAASQKRVPPGHRKRFASFPPRGAALAVWFLAVWSALAADKKETEDKP